MATDKQPAVYKKMSNIIEKAEQTRQKFATSLAKAKEDAEKLEQEVRELDNKAHEVYTLYLLDDVQLSAYEEVKSEADTKRKLLSVVQKKVGDIAEVEKQELARIYKEFECISDEFYKLKNSDWYKAKKQLQEAKDKFMQEVVDISKEQFKIYSLDRQIGDIQVDAGLKNYNYIEYGSPYIQGIGLTHTANDINIGTHELYEAFKNRNPKPRFM
ncbi:hypothetical protein [Terribacillus sp. AE2B 122]|uniref:hypothetical protein n=1 Tax=Terribacillus sp. AE2B 122 TaxID=1331902 RepID=UPI001582F301|nr:hypothetical protein [Terribacillus sp. AE2B 122]